MGSLFAFAPFSSGAVDRALIDGRLRLPAGLNVQSDAQNYLLNRVSRMDRRTSVPAALTECWTDILPVFW